MVPPPAQEDDELDDLLDDEPGPRSPAPSSNRRTARPRPSRAEPVRRWRSAPGADEPWENVVDDRPGVGGSPKPPVFWRARDSLYFEPLVALAILAILLVSLFAFTANWPPVYVVESNSMQHGTGDHLGVLNAGDIVLAQRVSNSSIVTYVAGYSSGFQTYGEYGDVILYYPNGTTSATPIVHRALLYLQYNKSNDTFNTTNLPANRCGTANSSLWDVPGSPKGCQTNGLSNLLYLYHIGEKGLTVQVDFQRLMATGSTHSGYLTLGDNNSNPDQLSPGIGPLSTLVRPGWIIGVARGLIPWFGALKLLLDGNAGKVPNASWEFLGLSIAGVIFAAAGIHLLLRRGRETRVGERGGYAFEEEEPPAPAPRRVAPPTRPTVQPWQATTVDEPDETPSPRRMSYEQRRRAHFTSSRNPPRPRRRRPSPPPDDETDDS